MDSMPSANDLCTGSTALSVGSTIGSVLGYLMSSSPEEPDSNTEEPLDSNAEDGGDLSNDELDQFYILQPGEHDELRMEEEAATLQFEENSMKKFV